MKKQLIFTVATQPPSEAVEHVLEAAGYAHKVAGKYLDWAIVIRLRHSKKRVHTFTPAMIAELPKLISGVRTSISVIEDGSLKPKAPILN